jgi:hypothetical protein
VTAAPPRRSLSLIALTALNILGNAVLFCLFFADRAFPGIDGGLFLPVTVLNGVVMLILLRRIRLSRLTETQKNNWTIIVVLAMGIGQLTYLMREPELLGED